MVAAQGLHTALHCASLHDQSTKSHNLVQTTGTRKCISEIFSQLRALMLQPVMVASQGFLTPLHCAAICNHPSSIKRLVEKGADIEAKEEVLLKPP
jgi:hypothetical protein